MSDQGTMEKQTDEEHMTFQDCVRRINAILEKTNQAFDSIVKLDVIKQTMRCYFDFEESNDVFEGFLHLIIFLDTYHGSAVAHEFDTSMVKLALATFHDFRRAKQHKDTSNEEGADQNQQQQQQQKQELVLPDDKSLVPKALKILSRLKSKYVDVIAAVFELNTVRMADAAITAIRNLLDQGDLQKAITWMSHLNLRDHFPFQEIICTLILENQTAQLYPFIGDQLYRQKKFIHYLNELLGDQLKRRPVSNQLEKRLVEEPKLLQKVTAKFVKHFSLPDADVPNLMKIRTQNALLHKHYQWRHGEISWDQFEEWACHALMSCPDVRDYYFRRLCCEWNSPNRAYHFAVKLGLPKQQYIPELQYFCEQCPREVEDVHESIKRFTAIQEQNQKLEEENECELEQGYPMVLVDKWADLEPLIDHLRNGGEELIGIDAEWRPHFVSTTEQISLIQIATKQRVYLVDALVLETNEQLTKDQWLNFLDALLCTKGMRKIGYDFRNDLRVLRNTFPWIMQLLPRLDNVVCMYRLLSQARLVQEANAALFDRSDTDPPKNLSLADVSDYFLGKKLEKSERVGNWSHRPLRLEQKIYAAQDAYCLRRIFRIVAKKLHGIRNTAVTESLKQFSLIKFDEEKPRPVIIPLAEGQMVRVGKEGQQDFITKVLEGATMVASRAGPALSSFKSIHEVRFVADSMLFGLGKNLRKCGFDTRLIADRAKIVEFCRLEENQDFFVLSTGKGHRQLDSQLPGGRAVCVPLTTDGTTPPSLLVVHLLHELKIHLRPEDMHVRCVECNKRAFIRLPRRIVQALFYMYAIQKKADWLEIGETELYECFERMRAESARVFSQSDYTEEEYQELLLNIEEQKDMLDDEQYFLFESEEQEICQTRTSAIDMLNRLVLGEYRGSPVLLRMSSSLKFRKDTFELSGVQFFVCAECGRLQLNSGGSE